MTIRIRHFAVMALAALAVQMPLAAQNDGYLGPGVLSRGAGTIGRTGTEDLDMRFFARVGGYYDSGLQSADLGADGKPIAAQAAFGESASFGLTGQHQWRRSELGIEYLGDYRRNTSGGNGNSGTNQSLNLGFSTQLSKRWVLELREVAGSVSNSTLAAGNTSVVNADLNGNFVLQNTSVLFDNRYDYAQTSAQANFVVTPRTIVSFGGDGFLSHYASGNLIGARGYNGRAQIQYRLSKLTSVGLSYQHTYYFFPKVFGESRVDTFAAQIGHRINKDWVASLQGGAYIADVQGLQSVALDPLIAYLAGISGTTVQTFHATTLQPYGAVGLTRQMRHGALSFNYSRTVRPGNGIQLASRAEGGGIAYNYAPFRRFNASASATYGNASAIGINLGAYRSINGSVRAGYTLTRSLAVDAGYTTVTQDLALGNFNRRSYQMSVGLSYNPNSVPISIF